MDEIESEAYFCRTYALPVIIGNGCWIGGGAIILPGVTIKMSIWIVMKIFKIFLVFLKKQLTYDKNLL